MGDCIGFAKNLLSGLRRIANERCDKTTPAPPEQGNKPKNSHPLEGGQA